MIWLIDTKALYLFNDKVNLFFWLFYVRLSMNHMYRSTGFRKLLFEVNWWNTGRYVNNVPELSDTHLCPSIVLPPENTRLFLADPIHPAVWGLASRRELYDSFLGPSFQVILAAILFEGSKYAAAFVVYEIQRCAEGLVNGLGWSRSLLTTPLQFLYFNSASLALLLNQL